MQLKRRANLCEVVLAAVGWPHIHGDAALEEQQIGEEAVRAWEGETMARGEQHSGWYGGEICAAPLAGLAEEGQVSLGSQPEDLSLRLVNGGNHGAGLAVGEDSELVAEHEGSHTA